MKTDIKYFVMKAALNAVRPSTSDLQLHELTAESIHHDLQYCSDEMKAFYKEHVVRAYSHIYDKPIPAVVKKIIGS